MTKRDDETDYFAQLPSRYDSYSVIGQEFDQVVMVLSDIFYYEDNILRAESTVNADFLYTQMLYQGITRARKGLAIIIWEDVELLESILPILTNEWPDNDENSDEII